jgi:hypothetical protein
MQSVFPMSKSYGCFVFDLKEIIEFSLVILSFFSNLFPYFSNYLLIVWCTFWGSGGAHFSGKTAFGGAHIFDDLDYFYNYEDFGGAHGGAHFIKKKGVKQ